MKFKEGDTVKAGQLLYVLDDERYQAVANQRKAALAAAEAELRRADRYFKRMSEADARGITQLERDNAEAAAESAKAGVLQAKANLVVAEYDLKKTKVYAPISGQIGKSNMYVGDYVAPSKGALARIVQIDPMRVTFPLTDRSYIAWRRAKEEGRPVIAVGTTSCRTMEGCALQNGGEIPEGGWHGWTNIFIYPGYSFNVVDHLITNFHLPQSTLIMLVSAFAGYENTMNAYRFAVEERFRFFSFGDAMLIE